MPFSFEAYPDNRDGYENSRYVALALSGPDAGAWHRGVMARTAFVDAGPAAYPLGATYAGTVYHHEKGHSADGQPFSWFIETADSYLDPESCLLVREVWPDFAEQMGPVTVSLAARLHPQDTPVVTAAPALGPGEAKADLLLTGRLFRVRYEGASAPTSCRIGTPSFDVSRTGQR